MSDTEFIENIATIGAVVYARADSEIIHQGSILMSNNVAGGYAVIYLSGSKFHNQASGNTLFSNNSGSLVAFNSSLTFIGHAVFENNYPPRNPSNNFQEGGAITMLFQSNTFIRGICDFVENHAENGGAILTTESKLYVAGIVTVKRNMAIKNGGGIHLSNSELDLQQQSNFTLISNTAAQNGGGIHAISSTIKTTSIFLRDENQHKTVYAGSKLYFISNLAQRGGGLSSEGSTRLSVVKHDIIWVSEHIASPHIDFNTTIFRENVADYGGAVYVDNATNSGTCNTFLQKSASFKW